MPAGGIVDNYMTKSMNVTLDNVESFEEDKENQPDISVAEGHEV